MAKRQLVALGVMFAAFAATPAGAQSAAPAHPSPPKAEKAAAGGEKKAEKAEARADKAEAKADKAEAKADKAEAKTDKADKAEGAPGADKGPGGPHAGHRHGHFRSGLHRLYADFKDGKFKKDEIKDKLAKLRETAGQRRNEHREELKTRWGRVLTFAPVREELRHHARRMAFLNRALFLAQTEVVKDKDKLLERIEKLLDRESERHEKAMERFKSMPPAAAAAAAAPAVPAAPAAIPASDKKGAEK